MPAKKKKVVKSKKPAKKKRIIHQRPATKKKIVKKAKKKAVAKKAKKEPIIGVITHYFPHVSAAVIKLKAPLSVGDNIKVKGHTTDFTQTVQSMQIDRVPIQVGKKGQEIGLMMNLRVRQHDVIVKA